MNIKKTTSYNKTLSILAICFCLVLAFVLFIPSNTTYADFIDLNENTIVNFNQEIQNENINHTFNTYNIWYDFATNLNTEHIYYISFNISDIGNESSTLFTSTANHSTRQTILSLNENKRYGYVGSITYGYLCTYANTQFTISNLNAIDLTLMFGDGNEPNLQQAQDYFTANYYAYNTGTAIPFSKTYLEGYNDGVNDVWESLTTSFNNDILGTITYPSTINGFESSVSYDPQTSRYFVEGLAMINFGSNITSQVHYTGTYFIPNYVGGVYIVFFKYEGETLTPLIISEISYNNTSNFCDITFNINNLDKMYFGFFNNGSTFDNNTSTTMYCLTSALEINTIDVALLTQSAYSRGVYETEKAYSEGGTKYQSIYNLGKAEGIAESNSYATGLDVVATTFTQVFSIFNIEILPGIPLTIFILLPLLVGLIMFIVKMTKGD